MLLNIVVVYLLEEELLTPWFIGTEDCEILTPQFTQKQKRARSSTNKFKDMSFASQRVHKEKIEVP